MFRHILTTLLALTGTAHAQQVATVLEQPKPFPLYYPAAEFDRPYAGTLIIAMAKDTTDVQKACNAPGPAMGCTLKYSDRCLIILAPDGAIKAYGWTTEAVKRHEIAHCNGWHPDHRGWRLKDR